MILVLNMVVLNVIWLTIDSTFISEIALASMIYPSVTPYHSGSKVSCRRPRLWNHQKARFLFVFLAFYLEIL